LRSETLILPNPTNAEETVSDDGAEPAFLLADSLRTVEFRYYDREGQELESWREAVESDGQPKTGKSEERTTAEKNEDQGNAANTQGAPKAGKLPAAVQCTLEFWTDPDRESYQSFTTRVLIPVEPEHEQ